MESFEDGLTSSSVPLVPELSDKPFNVTLTTTGGLYVGIDVGKRVGSGDGSGVGCAVSMQIHELPRTQQTSSSGWPTLPHMPLEQSEL